MYFENSPSKWKGGKKRKRKLVQSGKAEKMSESESLAMNNRNGFFEEQARNLSKKLII